MNYSLNDLLSQTAALDASDLYLSVDSPPMALVQGTLEALGDVPLTQTDTTALTQQVMNESQLREFQKTLEINLAYKLGPYRFRINIYYQRGTVAMVARLIKQDILGFAELRMPDILGELVMSKRGIILVTGATGSGKSTTLAAMIDYRNQNSSGHIVSVEDPIEFVHEHKGCIISQREVGIDTHSFQEALRNAISLA